MKEAMFLGADMTEAPINETRSSEWIQKKAGRQNNRGKKENFKRKLNLKGFEEVTKLHSHIRTPKTFVN